MASNPVWISSRSDVRTPRWTLPKDVTHLAQDRPHSGWICELEIGTRDLELDLRSARNSVCEERPEASGSSDVLRRRSAIAAMDRRASGYCVHRSRLQVVVKAVLRHDGQSSSRERFGFVPVVAPDGDNRPLSHGDGCIRSVTEVQPDVAGTGRDDPLV
jgi:hypothetical protein